jgi:hypothetical protein
MRPLLRSLVLAVLFSACDQDIEFAPDPPGCPTADSTLPVKEELFSADPTPSIHAASTVGTMWDDPATCFGKYQIGTTYGSPSLTECGGTFTAACLNRDMTGVTFTVPDPSQGGDSYCFFEIEGTAEGWTSTTSLLVYRDASNSPFELQQRVAQDGDDHVRLLTNGIGFSQRTAPLGHSGLLRAMVRFDGVRARLTTSIHVWCAPRAEAAPYAALHFRQLIR